LAFERLELSAAVERLERFERLQPGTAVFSNHDHGSSRVHVHGTSPHHEHVFYPLSFCLYLYKTPLARNPPNPLEYEKFWLRSYTDLKLEQSSGPARSRPKSMGSNLNNAAHGGLSLF
jgi:hypothetical protein